MLRGAWRKDVIPYRLMLGALNSIRYLRSLSTFPGLLVQRDLGLNPGRNQGIEPSTLTLLSSPIE